MPDHSFAVADAPTPTDRLGFQSLADSIADEIVKVGRDRTPWTLGVYGEWGCGKTSFLMMVADKLRQEKIEPIWFNAWKYSREEDLWLALIQTILDRAEVSGRFRAPWVKLRIWARSIDVRSGSWELARRLGVLAFRLALLVLFALMVASLLAPSSRNPVNDVLTGWLGGHGAVAELLGSPGAQLIVAVVALFAAKPESLLKVFDVRLGIDFAKFRRRTSYRDKVAFLDGFSDDFRDIIRIVYGDKPMVVVIDDLDRCLPEQTLQIIETVKLFLDVPGCVFLIAVDRDIVENAVAAKYKDLAEKEAWLRLGETYFEKVVQLPLSIPPVPQDRIDAFIRWLSDDPDVRTCGPILRGAIPFNPRRIKRNVQTFGLLKGFAAKAVPGQPLRPELQAKLVVIQSQFRGVYRDLLNDTSLLERLEQSFRSEVRDGTDGLGLTEIAKRYQDRYPGLDSLLRERVPNDSFAGVPLDEYLSFFRSVVPAPPPDEPRPQPVVAGPDRPAVMVVAYHRADGPWAQRLSRLLSASGYTVSLSEPNLDPGGPQIGELDGTDYLFPLISPDFLNSGVMTQISAAAAAADASLVPVRVRPCDWSELLAGHRGVDLVDVADDDAARAAVLSAVAPNHRIARDLYAAVESAGPLRSPSSAANNLPVLPTALVERGGLLAAVRGALESQESGTAVCVLTGLGGCGKTILAVQYATRAADRYHLIWWVNADGPDAAEAGLADLANQLGIAHPDDRPGSVRAVLSELSGSDRWLLVFDNASGPDEVARFVPSGSTGHVLITSRHRGWARYGTIVDVAVFARAESLELLTRRTGSTDTAALDQVAAALGDLPLALSMAASYIVRTATGPNEYLDVYRRHSDRLLARSDEGLSSVRSTVEMGIQQVGERDPVAAKLLELLAFVAPDPVPRTLLVDRPLPLEPAPDTERVNEALALLGSLSLIRLDRDSVTLHRLVQEVLRTSIAPDTRERRAADAFRLVVEALPDDPSHPATWPTWAQLLPHVMRASEHARGAVPAQKLTGVLGLAVDYLSARGAYGNAVTVAQSAVEVAEEAHGPDSVEAAQCTSLLARCLGAAGDLQPALAAQRRSLDVQRAAWGADDARVADALTTLAGLERGVGDFVAARAAQEEALTIYRAVLGEEHPKTATGLSNLAVILISLGEYDAAATAQQRALSLIERMLGPDHPAILRSLNNLAAIVAEQGDLGRAISLEERAIETGMRVLGPDHPDNAFALTNLARFQHQQGDSTTALATQQNALAIQQAALGPDHPYVADSLQNLARILRALDRQQEAEKADARARDIRQRHGIKG